MSSPTLLRLIGWVVYATFREALASRLFAATALVAGVCIVFCLSMRVEGEKPLPVAPGETRMRLPLEEIQRIGRSNATGMDVASSQVRFLFGAVRIHYRHYGEDAVRFVQLMLAGFVADTAGVLLALIWTAGFLPAFLDPARSSVLLVKPTPRWALLTGQYLGVLAFVSLQTTAFVVGTWLALGVATGEWTGLYLLCIPILILHFAVFFAVSAWLAVRTRSTTICLVGSLAVWIVCWCVNHGWHAALASSTGEGPSWLGAAYWMLPKPADLNWLLFELLHADHYFGRVLDYASLREEGGRLHLAASLATSLVFAAVLLASSARRFARTDY
ncbi:MAG TPA: ABC transporter permease subunit [Gemmataceae bacterium]|nr:ABC transporter permease subunit [Gemmataceae bacterium]